jgi:glycosyltransferase involved in cell wall biosynthesis
MSSASESTGQSDPVRVSPSDASEAEVPYVPSPARESQRKGVFIVIPAYNEAASIADVVASVREVYPNVVVVDDGSADETGALALRAGATRLRHVVNRGQGAALQTGIEHAIAQGAEVVVTFDADGQHAVDDIEKMIAPILEGTVDITLGSRFLGQRPDMPRARRLLLAGGLLFTRWTSGAKLTDTHNGLRAFSRRAASQIRIRLDGMAHASELLDYVHFSGLAYREVPVRIQYTAYSLAKGQRSSGAIRIVFDYFMDKFFS